MPCKTGTRESIEASKLYYQRERELDKTDPFRKLWRELVHRVCNTDLGYARLSHAEKKYFAVGMLEGEVYNGGFDQYFFNSSSSYYSDAEAGLEEMGAMQALSLLRRAKQIAFGVAPVPEDTGRRREILLQTDFESRAIQLDKLDDLFWEDPDGLSERAESFARKHGLV